MFVAKFNLTSGLPFIADRNGNYPAIGTVVAGKYHSSIINGTIFEREELITNTLYLCQNTIATDSDRLVITDSNGNDLYNVEIISKVSILELMGVQKELGAPFKLVSKAATVATSTEPETPVVNKRVSATVGADTEPVAGMEPDEFEE